MHNGRLFYRIWQNNTLQERACSTKISKYYQFWIIKFIYRSFKFHNYEKVSVKIAYLRLYSSNLLFIWCTWTNTTCFHTYRSFILKIFPYFFFFFLEQAIENIISQQLIIIECKIKSTERTVESCGFVMKCIRKRKRSTVENSSFTIFVD